MEPVETQAPESGPSEVLHQMLLKDLPLGDQPEPVKTWLKDPRELLNLIPWVLNKRNREAQIEFKIPQRRIVITTKLVSWLFEELNIDPSKVEDYVSKTRLNSLCRGVIENKDLFDRHAHGRYAIRKLSDEEHQAQLDRRDEMPDQQPPMPLGRGVLEPEELTQLNWRTLSSGSGDHLVYAFSWPSKRKAAVLDKVLLDIPQDADVLLRAKNLLNDPDLPIEVKVGYTSTGFASREENYQSSENADLLVEVMFETEEEARLFERACLADLRSLRVDRDWFRLSPNQLRDKFNTGLRYRNKPLLKPRSRT